MAPQVIVDGRSDCTHNSKCEHDCFMDASKFQELLSWSPDGWSHDTPGPGVPTDTLFDTFNIGGSEWFDGPCADNASRVCAKEFASDPTGFTNQSDWEGWAKLQVSMGVQNLETAAKNASKFLRSPVAPKFVLTIPYPDPGTRCDDPPGTPGQILPPPWGKVGGRELNFTVPADRLAAVTWWIDLVIDEVEQLGLQVSPSCSNSILNLNPSVSLQFTLCTVWNRLLRLTRHL